MNHALRRGTAAFSIILHLTLFANQAFAQAIDSHAAGFCARKSEVCVDGPSTKIINGVEVHKDCWEYSSTYECLEPYEDQSCGPLKQCENIIKECAESDSGQCLVYNSKYSCDQRLAKLPSGITELPPSHFITDEWDTTQCRSNDKNCRVVSEKCIEGETTKQINGVDVYRSCWKKERTMQCSTGNDRNQCSDLETDSQCTLKREQCTYRLTDGTCQINEKIFSCTQESQQTVQHNDCVDKDFAKAITSLEMTREMQRFYDPDKQRFFGGEDNRCEVKLGGAVDFLLGGDCCSTEAETGDLSDAAQAVGTSVAAAHLVSTVASHYTYTTLTGTVASAIGGAVGSGGVAAGGISLTSTAGGITIGVDPVSIAAAVGIFALSQYLKCEKSDTLTAMKIKTGLCHHVGSYCEDELAFMCFSEKRSYCCYPSKLAKIVSVGGSEQLKRAWGDAKNPSCQGFTAEELAQLDFSKLDLSDFYQDVYANMDNLGKHMNRAKTQVNSSIQHGKNEKPNYYDE